MATPGYTALPSTTHFSFEYKNELNAAAAVALGQALAATAERDFATMSDWFGGEVPGNGPILTKINVGSGGASNDNVNNINLTLGATADFDLARWTLVAEVMEIFMAIDALGWKPGDSSGEALSQLGANTLYSSQVFGLNGPVQWLDSSVNQTDPTLSRPDFVTAPKPTDSDFPSFGCALLFLYYLRSQLGFSTKAVVRAKANSLAGTYTTLTQAGDGLASFMRAIEARFPSGTPCGLTGSENPFPIALPGALSTRQLMAHDEMDPRLLGQRIRANAASGQLRAVLNSNRPVSLV